MKNKYVLYARKSSESEDRQVLSIGSQLEELKKIAQQRKLRVEKILKESHSAKAPGRPIFNEMVEKIKNEKYDGIITWNPDRLSRNPVDSGTLIYLLDTSKLNSIITPSQTFTNTPNDKFMLNILCGQAKLENDNKGLAVKRGLKRKAELGWYPTVAPTGYINTPHKNKGFKIIKEDPKRFRLVKKMWELMLTGNYTPPQIANIANNDWGFRTRKFRKQGGKPASNSLVYRIFHNPFYYGKFEWPKGSGKWYQGKHKAMIAKEDFDRVQALLGNKSNPRPKRHHFAFTGMIRCGECGCMVTAEKKKKHYPKTNNTNTYIYYRCTKKGPKVKCAQRYIRKKDLEKQILEILGQITIPESFKSWTIKHLKKLHDKENQDRNLILDNLQNNLKEIENKLDNLLDLRIAEQVSEKKYKQKKKELLNKKKQTKKRLEDKDYYSEKWREGAEKAFSFACIAKRRFKDGTLEDKKTVLSFLGSNFVLKDKKLHFTLEKPFVLIKEANNKMLKEYVSLEPEKVADKSEYLKDIDPNNPIWLRSSPFTLLQIFTQESITRVREQIKQLKKAIKSKPDYAIVKVSNGEFVKL